MLKRAISGGGGRSEGQTNSILNSDRIVRKRLRDGTLRCGRDPRGMRKAARPNGPNGVDTDGTNRAVKFSSRNSNYS